MRQSSTMSIAVAFLMCACLSACGTSGDTSQASVEQLDGEATQPIPTRTDTPDFPLPTNTCDGGEPTSAPPPTSTPTPGDDIIEPEPDPCQSLSGAATRADFPPSIPNPMNCGPGGYDASNYAVLDEDLPAESAEELDVIVVYEGRGAEHGPGSEERVAGVVQVRVHPRPKAVVLALSSYEPVRWRITLDPGATLSRVVVQGYYTQEVEGVPAGVPVLHAEPCGYAYGWEVEQNSGGGNYAAMIAGIRAVTGLHETSFQGCYTGDRFEVPYWTGEPPVQSPTPVPGDEEVLPRDIAFPGCETVTSESQYCLTATDGGIGVLGLDSGRVCNAIATTAPLVGAFTTSLAWRGEFVYSCTSAGLIRVSLRDGSWEAAQVPCAAVANFDGGLLLMADVFDPYNLWALRAYRDYEAVLEGHPYRSYNFASFVTRMAVHGERFYGAWHSTDAIDVGDLGSGESLGVLALENYDTWIWGMAVTDEGQLVLTDGDGVVAFFDVQTGAQVRSLPLAQRISGLACTSRDPAPVGTPTPVQTPEHPAPSSSPVPRPTSLPSCEQLAQSVGGPGRHADFSPSLAIEKNCTGGYGSSNYANPESALLASAAEEVHVVSVYKGAGNPGFRDQRQGMVTVNVAPRPKPVVLVLGAYESTLWRLHLEPGAQLARVIFQGDGLQLLEGAPDGTEVINRGPEAFCGNAYGWEISQGGGDYPLMIADIRAYTGLVETSFQGCYSGEEFDVPYWSGEPPTAKPTPLILNEDLPAEQIAFPGCEAVTQERQYCLTIAGGGPAVVGLETGNVCPLSSSAPSVGVDVSSLAWRGEAMYACDYEQGLVRVSLLDGSAEIAQVPCSAVTDDGGRLLVTSEPFGDGLYVYPSYTDLLNGDPSTILNVGWNSRMTAHGGRLYSAWHSTNTIDVYDLTTNQPLPPIVLADYDGWILGMAVTDNGELVISGDSWGDTLYVFDVPTGTKLREIRPATSVWGLACVDRAG